MTATTYRMTEAHAVQTSKEHIVWNPDSATSAVNEPGTAIAGVAPNIAAFSTSYYPGWGLERTGSILDANRRLTQPPSYQISEPPASLLYPLSEIFDSTTVMGEVDPIWSIALKLGDLLESLDRFAKIVKPLLQQLESPVSEEPKHGDSGDLIVFGAPNRVVRVRGRMRTIRRGEPLLVAEDSHE